MASTLSHQFESSKDLILTYEPQVQSFPKGYFRTVGDMSVRRLGKVRVLLVKAQYTYLSSVLHKEISLR